jgi:acetoacetate decarboxylase
VGLPFDQGWTIPFDSPHFPPLPAVYRDVRAQYVLFEADPAAIATVLPEPLEPDPEGRCVAIGLRIGFSSAYGAFNEAVVEERCLLDGRPGWYCSHVFHDGPRGIAAGREIYGTPKVFSELEVRIDGSTMSTRAAMAGEPVMMIRTETGPAVAIPDLPDLSPSWRLKIIPRADAPAPAVKQLVDASVATIDETVHSASRATGTVDVGSSALVDLSMLAPRRMGEAFVVTSSFSEGFGRIELDYLAARSSR